MHITTHPNDSGYLNVFNMSNIPFNVLRTFYITNVIQNTTLGQHAHYITQQLLICLQGQIQVDLFNGIDTTNIILNPNDTIYIPKLIWDSQTYITGKDILLVFCSTLYNPNDYIHNIDEYKHIIL